MNLKQKAIFYCTVLFSVVIWGAGHWFLWDEVIKPLPTTEEIIVDSTVMVENSSGIVIYSDEEVSLILTAHHNIADVIKECSGIGCEQEIEVINLKSINLVLSGLSFDFPLPETLFVDRLHADEAFDLALIEIRSNKKMFYSKLAKRVPRLGDDIWISSNPAGTPRSLTKGTLSATKFRFSPAGPMYEFSGGILYGSSGGGIFNKRGELIGIIRSMDLVPLDFICKNMNGDEKRLLIPVPHMGQAVPLSTIRLFLLNSPYSEYFNYIK